MVVVAIRHRQRAGHVGKDRDALGGLPEVPALGIMAVRGEGSIMDKPLQRRRIAG